MTDFGRRPGDMFRAIYDPNNLGYVWNSLLLDQRTLAQVRAHDPQAHTHTESGITDLDHDAQKIKGVIVNDAAIGDQKVLAYDLGTERIVYITPAPSGALLNSIQYGSIALTDTELTDTATITTVDLDKSVMFSLGDFGNLFNVNRFCLILELTADDTVTATRNAGNAGDAAHTRFCVLEFSSGIASSQRGRADLVGVNTLNVTITEVDVTKAILFYSGLRCTDTGTDALRYMTPELELINSTTLRITCSIAGDNKYVGWAVLEFA